MKSVIKKNQKNLFKISWFRLVITIVILSSYFLSGCKSDSEKIEDSVNVEQPIIYQEGVIKLPEDAIRISDYKRGENGSIILAGSTEIEGKIWKTIDNGSSYEEILSTKEYEELENINAMLINITLGEGKSDDCIVQYFGIDEVENTQQDYLIDLTGGVKEIQNRINKYQLLKNGEMYGLDFSNQIYKIDKETGNMEKIKGIDTKTLGFSSTGEIQENEFIFRKLILNIF